VPLIKRELFGLGSAIYKIITWNRPFPELSDNKVDNKYTRDKFLPLNSNIIRRII
jgi:hypothetical protein